MPVAAVEAGPRRLFCSWHVGHLLDKNKGELFNDSPQFLARVKSDFDSYRKRIGFPELAHRAFDAMTLKIRDVYHEPRVADFLQGYREYPLSYVSVNAQNAGGLADHNLNLEGKNSDIKKKLCFKKEAADCALGSIMGWVHAVSKTDTSFEHKFHPV